MLTDERIEDIADANGHASVISYGRPAEREVIWHDGDLTPFARAIESAACAERDARIAELEQQLEEARKDAERYLYLRNANMDERNRIEHYASSALDAAIDAAIKEHA